MKQLTDHAQLSHIIVDGYKSIEHCDIRMGALNILIGSNGAGKSNFIGFFRMIQQILERNLQSYVGKQGGPDAILHYGRKHTAQIKTELYFGNNGYKCTLEPTNDNRLMFANELFYWNMKGDTSLGSGHFESAAKLGTGTGIDRYVVPSISQWRVYHFHDTSNTAYVKQPHAINDNIYLREDAKNLAAFLYLLKSKYPESYQQIVKTIQLVAPFFGDFLLRPTTQNPEIIELEWIEKGNDTPFKGHHFSDGTLRFICLATVFLQPLEMQPQTILVDEPELGLHPYAITVLASLMRAAAKERQLIISSQSVELLNEFDPGDVIVADRAAGKSELKRLEDSKLSEWLKDYSLGELWKKNLLGGRPAQ